MAHPHVPEIGALGNRGGGRSSGLGNPLNNIFQLMERHPGTSFTDAAKALDVDLNDVHPSDFTHTYSSLSGDLRGQVANDLPNLPDSLGNALRSADPSLGFHGDGPGRVAPSTVADPANAAPPTPGSGLPASPLRGDGADRAGLPFGNDARLGTRIETAHPQSEISRQLFGDARTGYRDAVASTASPSNSTQTASADPARPSWTQTLTSYVQRTLGGNSQQQQASARADTGRVTSQQQPPAPLQAGNETAPRQVATNVVPQANVAASPHQGQGEAANFQAAQASPQQASANAGQQTAAFAQQAERAANDTPMPTQNGRLDTGAMGIARPQDPGAAVVMADRATPAQQQLPAQSTPPALTSLATTAQATQAQASAQQATGTTTLVNPQATAPSVVLPSSTNPMAQPVLPPGNDAAAMQARDTTALQPAGHTVAGGMRRSLRSGVDVMHKPVNWMLALMPGRARRRLAGEEESTSAQWAYWSLTAAAYIALGFAIFSVATTGGGLVSSHGAPTRTAYALAIAAVAACAAWAIFVRPRRAHGK